MAPARRVRRRRARQRLAQRAARSEAGARQLAAELAQVRLQADDILLQHPQRHRHGRSRRPPALRQPDGRAAPRLRARRAGGRPVLDASSPRARPSSRTRSSAPCATRTHDARRRRRSRARSAVSRSASRPRLHRWRRTAHRRRTATAIFQDISDSKRLEELRLRAERLEGVAELSASLAHEIKNPLASIRSAVEQLARAPRATTTTSGRSRDSSCASRDRLARLLSEFLDFARVRVARARAAWTWREVARGARDLARRAPRSRADGVERRVRDADRRTRIVEGDEDLLHRAVFNLGAQRGAGVAAHGGRVRVERRARSRRSARRRRRVRRGAVALRVTDAGAGHPGRDPRPAVRSVLHDEAGRQRTRARRRAARHRGAPRPRVRRQRRPSGTRFTVVLPRATRVTPPARARHRPHRSHGPRVSTTPHPSRPRSSTTRPGILESLAHPARERRLRRRTPRTAASAGLEQIARAAARHRRSPTCACRTWAAWRSSPRRAQQDPDTPVILMTAQATLQSAMQAVNEGAFYYIQKPFRNDELVAILRRAAEHRELRVENQSLKQEIRRRERTPSVARPSATAGAGSTCCASPRPWRPPSPRC